MPTAYIYRGSFEVRAGETLRYVEVAADGTISPEVTKTYAELAGSGSIAAAAVSLTPTVAAPTLTGVQIGAIEGVSVSLQPTVSPAAVSGVQVGSIAAASVSLRPTVAAPSVTGVRVGSISAAAVSCRPTVATGALTGVTVSAGTTETFSNAFTSWPYTGDIGEWNKEINQGLNTRVANGGLIIPVGWDSEWGESVTEIVTVTKNIPAGTVAITCRLSTSGSLMLTAFLNGSNPTNFTITSTTPVTKTFTHTGAASLGLTADAAGSTVVELIIDEVVLS